MFSKITLRAYKLLSLVAAKYLESYLIALKKKKELFGRRNTRYRT